jgi:hypothetical protein
MGTHIVVIDGIEYQPVAKEEFVWTDELVREFAEFYRGTQGNPPVNLWGEDLFDKWKQSKSSSLPKESIQDIINKETIWNTAFPQSASDNSRDWEVVKMHDIKYDGYITNDNKLPMYSLLDYREKYEKGRFVIHSVKRLSDGVV